LTGTRKNWLKEHIDITTLAVSVVLTAALVVWWSVFLHDAIYQVADLEKQIARIELQSDTAAIAARTTEIMAQKERWILMLLGESILFGMLLAASVSVLFVLARRRLRQREQLEDLLQVTSHEFKTPIAGVKALLQSLSLGSVPSDKRQELVQLGLNECERLEHLAETMLAYQRATADVASSDESIAADGLVNEILAHRASTGLQEAIQRDYIAPALVRADRDSVRVIIENLLDNARKYGGSLTTVSAQKGVYSWSLSVADLGSGFPASQADSLFDPFERNERGATTHGSGLGLAIARRLARRMSGDLTASSDGPGKGAVFTLTLPLADETHSAPVHTRSAHA
jgi:two-component system, OmpR family, sensor histidine kinase BaeS